MDNDRCCKGRDYAVYRMVRDKPGSVAVNFCGTVYAEDLTSAEAIARLMYPVSGSDYLEVEEDQP